MGSPIIFSGNNAKLLKTNLDFFGSAQILTGTVNPTTTATTAQAGSLYLNTSSGAIYRKLDNGSSTNWLALGSSTTGDITPTSFSAANNQASPSNITGLFFPNASVRAATIYLSVNIAATIPLFEYFTLNVVQKTSTWDLSSTSVGDNSGFLFTIGATGQVLYTSPNSSGFTSTTVRFRAQVI